MNSKDLYKKYLDALIEECEIRIKDYADEIKTIYLGGGTPSIVGADLLEYFFNKLFKVINLDKIKETTVEFNVNDVNEKTLEVVSSVKNIRLSLGLQTFNENSLNMINRGTQKKDLIKALKLINLSSMENISLDFICGLPLNDIEQSKNDVLYAFDLLPKIKHISLYYLELGDSLKNKWRDFLPTEYEAVNYYEAARKTIESLGLSRYEISNYAVSGYESLHNYNYWSLKDYLGIGAGAFGCYDNSRYENTKNVKDYLNSIEEKKSPVKSEEYLDAKIREREFLFLSLRTAKGINISRYDNLFGGDKSFNEKYSKIINRNKEYFVIYKENLSIKKRYFDYADQISLLLL